jgi:ABC-type phosphate transport system auxiliary subunit
MLNGIRDAMASLEARMDRRFEQLETRMDARFAQVDARFIQMEARFGQLDQRVDSLDAKMSRQFVWLVGILVTALVAVLGVLGAITSAMLGGRI